MILPTIKILLLFIIFFSSCISSWCQVNYYAPENIYDFANYLCQSGDFIRAAAEYQRYFFSIRAQPFGDSLLFKIGYCYQRGGNPEIALNFYQCFLDQYPQSKLREQTHYQIARTHFQTGEYDQSICYIENHRDIRSSNDASIKMAQLLGINYLYQHRWQPAQRHFSVLLATKNFGKGDSTTIYLNNFAAEGTALNYKSAFLAGLLSAGLPGTGKIYAGRYEDGIFSLMTIGLYCWQAFDGFNRNGRHSVKGWVYGTLSTIFYLGNVYGSVVAAKIHNEKIEGEFLHKLELELKW